MNRSIIIAGIVIALLPGVAVSDDAPADTRRQARKLADTTVITNDLLERLYGPAAPGAAPTETVAEPVLMDAMEELEYQLDSRRTTRNARILAGERVAEAEAALKNLEARKLAVANPYLPRPVLTPTEAAEWEGLDNAGRLRHTEEAIRKARKELEAAREELSR